MNKVTKFVGVLAALVVGSSAFAQTAPVNPATEARSSASLLGFRYVEAGLGYVDVNKTSVDAWATGVTYNQPLAPNIDVSVDFFHSWAKGHSTYHADSIGVNGIYYYDTGMFKTFGGVGLGYTWVNHDANTTDWNIFGGIEYIVNPQVSVTATLSYDSDFKRGNDNDGFSGAVRGNYWFTRQISAFAGISWLEGGNFGYAGGVTYKF